MTEDWPQTGGAGLALTVTVSCEPGFVPTVEALAARIGEYVGCRAEAAQQVARAVAHVLQSACQHMRAQGTDRQFEISFKGNDHLLCVDLTSSCPLPEGVTLEDAVARATGSADWRRLVDRIEFGDAKGCPYCRLTHQIRDIR